MIVWGPNEPKFPKLPRSEFRNSNLLESAAILFGSRYWMRCVCARFGYKGKRNDEIVPDHGRRGKGRGGGREGDDTSEGELHVYSRWWQCVSARERSEQMRALANARNKLEDAGGDQTTHAGKAGWQILSTLRIINFQNTGVLTQMPPSLKQQQRWRQVLLHDGVLFDIASTHCGAHSYDEAAEHGMAGPQNVSKFSPCTPEIGTSHLQE